MGLDANPDCGGSIGLALTPPTLTQLNPGTPLCPDIGGDVGEVSVREIPPPWHPLVEGSLIPQGQRPCVCGNSNRSNGSEFPDSSITNIFHSSLPSFCPLASRHPSLLPLSFIPPAPATTRSPPFPPASPFILLSIFSYIVRAPRASAFFFSIGELSMDDTVLTTTGGENNTRT